MCEGDDQLIFPALGDAHCTVGGVIIYLVLLFWCFLGVALIADIFMAAIETITSKEEAVTQRVQKDVDSDELVEKEFTVKVGLLLSSFAFCIPPSNPLVCFMLMLNDAHACSR